MDFQFQKVESIQQVPEQFREIYKENDGKFQVGGKFKNVADAIIGLNQSLKAVRTEA